MSIVKQTLLAVAIAVAASAALAAPVSIVNLSANPPTPNAGHNSGTYPYNPVDVQLAAGVYKIGEISQSKGGLYDAYTVYADTGANGAWTDSQWGFSIDGGVTTAASRASIGRFDTAAAAIGAYSALAPLTLTLNNAAIVSFFLNDSAQPFFGDDTNGVSLGITLANPTATGLPEPMSLSLVGVAVLAMGAVRHRARKNAA